MITGPWIPPGRAIHQKIRGKEGKTVAQEVERVIYKCAKLCEDAAFKTMKGKGRDEVQQTRNKFASMIEIISFG